MGFSRSQQVGGPRAAEPCDDHSYGTGGTLEPQGVGLTVSLGPGGPQPHLKPAWVEMGGRSQPPEVPPPRTVTTREPVALGVYDLPAAGPHLGQ